MVNFLLEILCEELPNDFLNDTKSFLESKLKDIFKDIFYKEYKIFITPRRIGFLLKDVNYEQKQESEIVIGPPKAIAFDKNEEPTKALIGFLQKNNSTLENIIFVKKDDKDYVAIEKFKKALSLKELLEGLSLDIIKQIGSLSKKPMRWLPYQELLFPRPIRSILALLNEEVLSFKLNDIVSSNQTYGHRLLGRRIELSDPTLYEDVLRENFVIPSFEERKLYIKNLLDEKNRAYILSETLLNEITNLTEMPFLIEGSFDKDFLALPEKVIITVLAKHQRFICTKDKDSLSNIFYGISNNKDSFGYIKDGYEKVIRARLSDALFFYKEDLKLDIYELVNSLKDIVFHVNLGTMLDKVYRMVELAKNVTFEDKEKLEKACFFSKFDLFTNMVKEFDELQGYMGYVYALEKLKDKDIAISLYEQYLPDLEGNFPKTKLGAFLSLIDKLESLSSFIAAREYPKGSSDAFGLKRLTNSIIAIIDKFNIPKESFNIRELSLLNYSLIKDKSKLLSKEELLKKLEELFLSRLKAYFSDIPYDILDSVLESKIDIFDIKAFKEKIDFIIKLERQDIETVAKVYKRVKKIIPKDFKPSLLKEDLLETKEEKDLFNIYKALNEEKNRIKLVLENYKLFEQFFDNVLVMDKREDYRINKLSLLYLILDSLTEIANFDKIVIKEVS